MSLSQSVNIRIIIVHVSSLLLVWELSEGRNDLIALFNL